jgi:YHS domain-containing protein
MMNRLILTLTLVGCTFGGALAPDSSVEPSGSERLASSRAYLGSRNLPAHGVAIEGYSPVSYFHGKAERGSALFAVEHDGVTYHLANAAQVEEFERDPARYAPAFGGWCAFGMAISDKFPIDPNCYKIVGGRLYLFLRNEGIDALKLWNDGDEADLRRKAEAHWAKVQG